MDLDQTQQLSKLAGGEDPRVHGLKALPQVVPAIKLTTYQKSLFFIGVIQKLQGSNRYNLYNVCSKPYTTAKTVFVSNANMPITQILILSGGSRRQGQ